MANQKLEFRRKLFNFLYITVALPIFGFAIFLNFEQLVSYLPFIGIYLGLILLGDYIFYIRASNSDDYDMLEPPFNNR